MRLKAEDGFTILELLIVVAILAALAGGVIMVLDGTQEDSASKVAQSEMLEIKKALLKFKQDTGYLPKTGPFSLATEGGSIPLNRLPSTVPVGQEAAWFNSPANFWVLYGRDEVSVCTGFSNPQSPLCGTGHALETWNPDTGRGWRGPYLTRQGEGLVDIGNGLGTNGSGSPLTGILLSEVRGVADPFVAKPEGSFFVWRTSPGSTPHDRWGRPFFLFDLNDNNNARIVGMGPNRTYNNETDDDIILYIFK